jgi:predicted neutral ceramidase superfamily lipid hydrolase
MELGLNGGTNFQYAGGAGSGIGQITAEELSGEIDEAVAEAVAETMVNIGEVNIFESEVNVFTYKDVNGDGEPELVEKITSIKGN